MKCIFGGAALIVAGIAAFIEAHAHHPVAAYRLPRDPIQRLEVEQLGVVAKPASGLDPAVYDLLRIGAWALVIFGALLVIVGLVRTIQQGA